MKKQILIYGFIAVVVVVAIVGISILAVNNSGKAYLPEHEYAMVELGSADCAQCQLLKPEFERVQEIYGNKIDIVYFDIKNTKQGAAYANQYRVNLTPTIIFVNKAGEEIKRVTGYQSREELVKILRELGWIE